jgi:hypothetical protein
MEQSSTQQRFSKIIIAGLGIVALFCFFKGFYLWTGIVAIAAAVVAEFLKRPGTELLILIGIMIISIQYHQTKLWLSLNLIIMTIALCDMVVLFKVSKELTGMEEQKKQEEFIRRFRQRETLHSLLMKVFHRKQS